LQASGVGIFSETWHLFSLPSIALLKALNLMNIFKIVQVNFGQVDFLERVDGGFDENGTRRQQKILKI
jgi:hypothetical protein